MLYLIALILKLKERTFGHVATQGFLQKIYFIFLFSFPLQDFPHSLAGKESTCNAGDPDWIPGSGRSAGEGIGLPIPSFLSFPCGSAGKESACSAGDLASVPGFVRSPGEGKGYPLQCSGLENSTDSIFYGVARSWT